MYEQPTNSMHRTSFPVGTEGSFESNGSKPLPQSPFYGDKLEPIAVIGMSAKLPQNAHNIEGFWNMLINARSAMTDIPKDRYNLEAFYHADPSRDAAIQVRGGHFLKDDIAAFDAPFFNIHGQEAACMDPQQRGLLECSYRALENEAGIPISKITGTKTSVHIGNFSREYEAILLRDTEMKVKYMATGTSSTMLANRISWFYNLHGPSVSLDTACSGGLLAVHMACQGLRSGESEMSIVGGCNLCFNPSSMYTFTNLNFLSPDSRCYTFDHRANGYARGEGFGIVILKPLSAAIRDGNTIRGIIRASGTNQDGRTPGITLPSSEAQQQLIRETYAAGGLDLKTTRFFEAHGTGTPAGDPLEVKAIGEIFGPCRSPTEPLYIGSVKTNIGHLESGSGIAGLIKSILILEKGMIPPNINFEKPNPKLKLDEQNLAVPLSLLPWPVKGLRRVSVNSFGFGGSNVHLVVDDALHYLELRGLSANHHTETIKEGTELQENGYSGEEKQSNGLDGISAHIPRLIVLSAADEDGVWRQKESYLDYFNDLSPACKRCLKNFDDLVYTLNKKRTLFPWRNFVVAGDYLELQAGLDNMPKKPSREVPDNRLALCFTGQGAQWSGMGKELMAYTVFRESIEAADDELTSIGCTWSVKSVIIAEHGSPDIDQPDISQTICTVLQIALVDLLDSWNIHPIACIGHSSGEIAAAYSCCMISRNTAWKIAYSRGLVSLQAQQMSRSTGAMIAVGLSEAEAHEQLRSLQNQMTDKVDVTIACINSPRNVTLSGRQDHLEALANMLNEQKIFHRSLRTGNAYHSHYMNAVSLTYKKLIGHVELPTSSKNISATMYSTVTGRVADIAHTSSADYWIENLLSPVQFSKALDCLIQDQNADGRRLNHFLEVGPNSALRRFIDDTVSARGMDIQYIRTLQANQDCHRSILDTAGHLFSAGYDLDLKAINSPENDLAERHLLVDLPEYNFDHSKSYWLESYLSKNYRFRGNRPHELLGKRTVDYDDFTLRWRLTIQQHELPWIEDHKINNALIYPAAGMLVMAIEALRQILQNEKNIVAIRLKSVKFLRSMNIPDGTKGLEATISLQKRTESNSSIQWHEFTITSYDQGEWQENCRGFVAAELPARDLQSVFAVPGIDEVSLMRDYEAKCWGSASTEQLYKKLDEFGYGFGPSFRVITSIRYDEAGNAITEVSLKDWANLAKYPMHPHLIHPTALDGFFQSIFVAFSAAGTKAMPTLVPTQIKEMWLSSSLLETASATALKAFSHTETVGFRETMSEVSAFDTARSPKIWIRGLEATVVAQNDTSSQHENNMNDLAFRMEWKPDHTLMTKDELKAYCSASASSLISETSNEIEETETACFIYLRRVLGTILEKDLDSTSYLSRYFKWAQFQLDRVEKGTILHQDILSAGVLGDKDKEDLLLEKVRHGNVEARLCSRVGDNLTNILTGKQDPLELLFKDTLLDEYYAWSLYAEGKFQKIANYLDMVAHKNPSMKILEIGAGTGSGTSAILDVLSPPFHGDNFARYSHLTFTDISPSFFEKAKIKFASQLDRMQFKTLDISRDPLFQGFEVCAYDLILAITVFHATPVLLDTLKNARMLLKPGGTLMLFEQCNVQIARTGFVFGVLPGWWLGSEPERQRGPLLSEPDWAKYLTQAGFSDIELMLRDSDEALNHCRSMIVATAVELKQPNGSHELFKKKLAIVTAEDSQEQHELASQISAKVSEMLGPICEIANTGSELTAEHVIYLAELEAPVISDLSETKLKTLKAMVDKARLVIWAGKNTSSGSEDPSFGAASGWARSIRSEYRRLKFVTLLLQRSTRTVDLIEKILLVLELNLKDDRMAYEEEYEERESLLWIPRILPAPGINQYVDSMLSKAELQPLPIKSAFPMEVAIGTPGLLNTLHFIPSKPFDSILADDEIEIETRATGLNYKDLLILLGQVSNDYIGEECAGIINRLPGSYAGNLRIGDRVCCIARGTYKTLVRTKICLVATVPDCTTWAEAGSFLLAFATAYYCMFEATNLRRGDKILIHSGAGGVGQAAIQLAKYAKLEINDIFVTVGSDVKKKYLVQTYGLHPENILSSSSFHFAEQIKTLTGGYGVDMVLNSLGGEALRRSLDCIAPYGRLIEIGLKDAMNSLMLPMQPFCGNVGYISVNLNKMLLDSPQKLGGVLQRVSKLLNDGVIHTPIAGIYGYSQLEEALRILQSGRNQGKLVIEVRDDDNVMAFTPQQQAVRFDPNSTYVISGLGGLGRSIAVWMTDHGCKNLLLLSRSGEKPGATSTLISKLRHSGVRVEAPACDVSDIKSLSTVLNNFVDLPPIKGCFQAAMVLRDGIFEKLSLNAFHAALDPKTKGSWNLHTLLPQKMDFFIMLSSLNGIVGSMGQSSYAAGNTYQDSLAHYRTSRGEKAIAIDLGRIESVGYVAEKIVDTAILSGYIGISEKQLLAILNYYCNPESSTLSLSEAQVILGIENPKKVKARGQPEPWWSDRAMCRMLHQIETTSDRTTSTPANTDNYKALFKSANDEDERSHVFLEALRKKLSKTISTAAEDFDDHRSMSSYGTDSLIAVKLKNWIQVEFDIEVAVFDILSNMSMRDFAQTTCKRSRT